MREISKKNLFLYDTFQKYSQIYLHKNLLCLYLIQRLYIKEYSMDINTQVRKKREDLRNSLKMCLTKSGHVGSQLPEPIKNQVEVQKTEKAQQETQPQTHRMRRKTSLDIRVMGDTFDMFECNEVFIFNDFDEMYQLVRKIDEGGQAVVFEAFEKKTNSKYAVKVIRKKDQDIIQSLKTQFRILKNLNHPNIIKAYNLFIDQRIGISHLVLEYCQFPNLRYYMTQHRILKETEIVEILTLILHALVYLHSQGVCHRDIKPQNILFNPTTREIKLIDFQISKMIKYDHQKLEMLGNVGTTYYKAPEILNCSYYHQQVDIWAVGVICYQMVMGLPPFRHKFQSELIKQIRESEPKYDNANVTDFCIAFMKKCLEKDPLKRFSATQALKSPFLLKYSSISSSTNSSPMRRKNSQQHIKNSFGIEVSKCLNEDSGLKNVESLGIDSGIRVKINEVDSGKKKKQQKEELHQ